MADLDDIVQILEQIRDDAVPGLTSAVDELSSATAAAGEASREAAEAARESSTATDTLSDSMQNLSEQTREAEEETNSFTKGLSKMGKGIGGAVKGIAGFGSALANLDPLGPARDIIKFTQDIRRSTGMNKELAQQIGKTSDAMRIYGVSAEEASDAIETLYTETSVFSQMSIEVQANLAKEAALMAELGVSTSDYAKGIETSMKAMGTSADQAADNMRFIRAAAKDLNMPVAQLTRDFANAESMMAKLGDTGLEAFVDLQAVVKATGLSMDKLLGVTDQFDTFEGAAEAVGGLNAALGGNYVDAMSMMMETDPSERIKMIRSAIDDAGVAFEDMEYYQKKMLMNSIPGLNDMGEAARLLSGDIDSVAAGLGEADASVQAAQEEAFTVRTPEEIAQQMADALKPAFGEIANTISDASEEFAAKMLPTTQSMNAASIEMTKSFSAGENAAMFTMIVGLLTYLPQIIGLFGKFSAIASSVGAVLSSIGTFISGIGSALGGMTTVVVAFKAAVVVGLLGGFMGIAEKWDEIVAALKVDPFAGIALAANSFITGIIAMFGKIAAYVAEFFGFDAPWITLFKDAFKADNFDKIMTGWIDVLVDFGAKFEQAFIDLFIWWDNFDFAKMAWDAGTAIYEGFIDFFDIDSPSKVMLDSVGGPMVDGILQPFTGVGDMLAEMDIVGTMLQPFKDFAKFLQDIMTKAYEMIPAPIKSLITGEGGVVDTATELADMATEGASAAMDKLGDLFLGDEGEDKAPYVIDISLNMDGREFDRKIINVVGGIARDATGR